MLLMVADGVQEPRQWLLTGLWIQTNLVFVSVKPFDKQSKLQLLCFLSLFTLLGPEVCCPCLLAVALTIRLCTPWVLHLPMPMGIWSLFSELLQLDAPSAALQPKQLAATFWRQWVHSWHHVI